MNNNETLNTLPEPIAKGEEKIVVNNIQVRSADRSRKDISDWKQALITAESVYNPNRTRLYDLYEDVILDGHLSGIISKRIDAVLNKGFYFQDKAGNRVDTLDEVINSRTFRGIMREVMLSIFWGISGLEFIPGKEVKFKKIPRKHIKPKWGIISTEQNGREGVAYATLPNIFIVGEADDLGVLLKCATYALLKRGNLADWAQFIEIFGQPMRVIKYEAHDRQAKVELQEVLDQSGSSLALLIPKTADFELMDGKATNANGELQDKFKNAMNDEMSICVLGNIETSGNNAGGSLAKAKEQRKDQLEITRSDIDLLLGYLNSPEFIAILKTYGLPVTGGKFVSEQEVDMDTVKAQVEIAERAKQLGLPIDDDYLYELTGIPKPKNYNKLKSEQSSNNEPKAKTEIKDDDAQEDVEDDVEDLSDTVWNKIRHRLANFFVQAP